MWNRFLAFHTVTIYVVCVCLCVLYFSHSCFLCSSVFILFLPPTIAVDPINCGNQDSLLLCTSSELLQQHSESAANALARNIKKRERTTGRSVEGHVGSKWKHRQENENDVVTKACSHFI